MAIQKLGVALCLVASVVAHGFVKNINIDGSIWPGFDPHRDTKMGLKRIAFGFQAGMTNVDGTASIQDVNNKDLACNAAAKPPAYTAPVRAGSNMDFFWTKWLPSHQGPMTTWMAPYTGDINTVDINKLQFFKIHEGGLYSDGSWATDRMIAHERTWNTTIPWDIKPGTYVVRHELLSLHFATTHSNYSYIPGGMVAPQFYPSCYSVNVTGSGSATPANRVTFPGAYQKNDPGLNFDIFAGAKEYPIPGPKVYQPTGIAPKLNPNPVRWMSPTGDGEGKDADYMKSREAELKQWEKVTDFFQAIGG